MSSVVYRFFSADDTLLYVGITTDFRRRMNHHRSQTPWFMTEVGHIEVDPRTSIAEAHRAEVAAIRDELPVYNVRHNPAVVPPKWGEVA